MLKGYAKPIVFSLLVGMLMLTGVYSYAVQQSGVVPFSIVLASSPGNNEFYKIVIEAKLPNYQTVNYTITPENTTVYIPAYATINRFIPFINVTEPYLDTNCFYIDTTVVIFRVSYLINGEAGGSDFSINTYLLATNEDCTVATLYGYGWFFKTLNYNQVWEIKIWAVSYLVQP